MSSICTSMYEYMYTSVEPEQWDASYSYMVFKDWSAISQCLVNMNVYLQKTGDHPMRLQTHICTFVKNDMNDFD
jgi:hypothetical protein